MSIETKDGVKIDNYDDAVNYVQVCTFGKKRLDGVYQALNQIPIDNWQEFLSLSDFDGRSVAHGMAARGYEFTDPEVLKLSDNYDWTVAHEMALRGHEFTDPEVLQLADKEDRAVADICDEIHKTSYFNAILKKEYTLSHDGPHYINANQKIKLLTIDNLKLIMGESGDDPDNAENLVAGFHIENYIPDGPGYTGPVVIALYNGGVEFQDTYIKQDGKWTRFDLSVENNENDQENISPR